MAITMTLNDIDPSPEQPRRGERTSRDDVADLTTAFTAALRNERSAHTLPIWSTGTAVVGALTAIFAMLTFMSSNMEDKVAKGVEPLKVLIVEMEKANVDRFTMAGERFDGMDKRLDGMDKRLDGMDKRLDGVDKRLDSMEVRMDTRMDSVETKLDRLVEDVSALKAAAGVRRSRG